jgi:hypothetical protein
MVYGVYWPPKIIINRPQPKNVLFDVHNYPYLLLLFCDSFKIFSLFEINLSIIIFIHIV